MADSDILINPGSSTKIDTRTVGVSSDEHRQVVVIGDPVVAANVQAIDSAGRANVKSTSSTGGVTSVSAVTSSTALLASNASRTGFIIFNDGSARLFVNLAGGTPTTTTSWSIYIDPGGYYVNEAECWSGAINGVWAGTGGAARITEYS